MDKDTAVPKKNKGRNKGWDNLTPAKKGEVRNPKGRPKKEVCIPDILRRLSSEPSKYDPEHKRTRLEEICNYALGQAEGGDAHARSWIADRMEGRALERVLTKELEKDELIIE